LVSAVEQFPRVRADRERCALGDHQLDELPNGAVVDIKFVGIGLPEDIAFIQVGYRKDGSVGYIKFTECGGAQDVQDTVDYRRASNLEPGVVLSTGSCLYEQAGAGAVGGILPEGYIRGAYIAPCRQGRVGAAQYEPSSERLRIKPDFSLSHLFSPGAL
jgi:hypothetical protein